MTGDVREPDDGATEFVGAGQTVNDAVVDAILAANRGSGDRFGTQAEVVAWGVHAIGIGGACSFWVKIRKGAPVGGAASGPPAAATPP